ncbi:hypothetical protein [Neptunomonas japonica]|uniref:hypothetical protein n=1 Tax=Neptunomonas japonica TaxID=417574 RepID=UPI001915BAB6|nr:hypothetical protein [Neptunomonas japonica]
MQSVIQKIETDMDIDMCLGVLSALLTHNGLDLISQDDMHSCLKVLDEKLRKIRGEGEA